MLVGSSAVFGVTRRLIFSFLYKFISSSIPNENSISVSLESIADIFDNVGGLIILESVSETKL